MKGDLIVSGNLEYIELARRLRVEKNLAERYRNIEGGNYARFVKVREIINFLPIQLSIDFLLADSDQ